MLQGQVVEIMTSRSYVSFGGFMTFKRDDVEYQKLKKIFVLLSNKYQFYCNHVVLKIQFFDDIYYIGYNDNEIHIGNTYHRVVKEDSRESIPVNCRLVGLYREAGVWSK